MMGAWVARRPCCNDSKDASMEQAYRIAFEVSSSRLSTILGLLVDEIENINVTPVLGSAQPQPPQPIRRTVRRGKPTAEEKAARFATSRSGAAVLRALREKGGSGTSEAIIDAWWRQGMMGGAKAHYDGIVAFSQTDFTDDLKQISVPVLVMHGDDDQVVPYADSGPLTAKLVKNGTLKTYHGYPHGMPTTHAASINADLLAWLQQ